MFNIFKKKPKLPMRSKRMNREDYIFMGAQGALLTLAIYCLTQFNLPYWAIGLFIVVFFVAPIMISLHLIDQDIKLGREVASRLVIDKLPDYFKDGIFIGKDFNRLKQYIIPEITYIETEKSHKDEDVTVKHLYYIEGYDIVIDVVENKIINIYAFKV